jgi:hypothetical protein
MIDMLWGADSKLVTIIFGCWHNLRSCLRSTTLCRPLTFLFRFKRSLFQPHLSSSLNYFIYFYILLPFNILFSFIQKKVSGSSLLPFSHIFPTFRPFIFDFSQLLPTQSKGSKNIKFCGYWNPNNHK